MRRREVGADYTAVTELPASGLHQEQLQRLCQRYGLGADHAVGRRTLEIACGAGLGLAHVANTASHLVALDYTPSVVQIAQQHNPQVPLLCADAHDLPFATGAFDRILNFEAIYYLHEPLRLLQECHRVLEDKGALLICTSNPHWPHFVPGQMSIHYPSVPQLHTWLQASGFRVAHFFGAFASEAKGEAAQWVSRLRKWLLAHQLVAPESRWGRLGKRLVHGRPLHLPPTLSATLVNTQGRAAPLKAIAPTTNDTTHRVIYAAAYK